jgi:hypothetical protein
MPTMTSIDELTGTPYVRLETEYHSESPFIILPADSVEQQIQLVADAQ